MTYTFRTLWSFWTRNARNALYTLQASWSDWTFRTSGPLRPELPLDGKMIPIDIRGISFRIYSGTGLHSDERRAVTVHRITDYVCYSGSMRYARQRRFLPIPVALAHQEDLLFPGSPGAPSGPSGPCSPGTPGYRAWAFRAFGVSWFTLKSLGAG